MTDTALQTTITALQAEIRDATDCRATYAIRVWSGSADDSDRRLYLRYTERVIAAEAMLTQLQSRTYVD